MMQPEDTFRALIAGICRQAWDEVTDLYAEDAAVEHPNASSQSPVPRFLNGKAELRQHFLMMGDLGFVVKPYNLRIHHTGDPEVIVCEFEYHGRSKAHPEPFVMPNIFVMHVRNGRIVESRDYQGNLRS